VEAKVVRAGISAWKYSVLGEETTQIRKSGTCNNRESLILNYLGVPLKGEKRSARVQKC